jgi:hypothetical protein
MISVFMGLQILTNYRSIFNQPFQLFLIGEQIHTVLLLFYNFSAKMISFLHIDVVYSKNLYYSYFLFIIVVDYAITYS